MDHTRLVGPRRTAAALALGLALALGAACASDGTAAPEVSTRPPEPARIAPPADLALSRVELGMNDDQVREIMGRPSGQNAYPTIWAYLPGYTGADERRFEWRYTGTGRVLFNQNPYSGRLQVIRVEYDPSEDGA